jgi:hypothetical protein
MVIVAGNAFRADFSDAADGAAWGGFCGLSLHPTVNDRTTHVIKKLRDSP